MISVILYAILAWFLYNLVFRFIIPIWRTSSQIRKKFREMQEQVNQQPGYQQNSSQNSQTQTNGSSTPPTPKKGDYIDFEEVK